MTVIEQLLMIAKHYNMGQNAFEKSCGLSQGYTHKVLKSPSVDVIRKIHLKYPDINPMWLAYGEGEMIIDAKAMEEQKQRNEELSRLVPTLHLLTDQFNELKEKYKLLELENAALKAQKGEAAA